MPAWQKLVGANATVVTNFTYSVYRAKFTLGPYRFCNKKGECYEHTCALKTDGSAACWGRNANFQLGDGNGLDSNTAVQVSGGAVFWK